MIQDWTLGRLTSGSHSSHQSEKDAADWLMDCGCCLPLHSTSTLTPRFFYPFIGAKLNSTCVHMTERFTMIKYRLDTYISLPHWFPGVFLHVNFKKNNSSALENNTYKHKYDVLWFLTLFVAAENYYKKTWGKKVGTFGILLTAQCYWNHPTPCSERQYSFNLSELAFDLDPLWHG